MGSRYVMYLYVLFACLIVVLFACLIVEFIYVLNLNRDRYYHFLCDDMLLVSLMNALPSLTQESLLKDIRNHNGKVSGVDPCLQQRSVEDQCTGSWKSFYVLGAPR